MKHDPQKYNKKRHQYMNMGRVFVKRTSGGIRAWIRAQIILFSMSLCMLMLGLYLLNIPFWGLKAFLIAFVDGLPLLGSGIVLVPWAILKLLVGQGMTALWLIVLYLILVITRQIVEPIIFGKSIGLKPIWTFLTTVICMLFWGPIGAVIGALAAIVIRVILTIRDDYLQGAFATNYNPDNDDSTAEPYIDDVDPNRFTQAKDAGSDDE